MERSKAKEAGRRKYIREKANALKDKPPRKAPASTVMKQAGRYRAIEKAKKQLVEAQQAIVSDQEQEPHTAVDKVESYSVNAAHDVLQALPSARKPRQPPDNPFHHETDYPRETPRKPRPQDRMRREAVKEFRQRRQAEQKNTYHGETHFEPPEVLQPKDQIQRSFVRQLQAQAQQTAKTTPLPEVQEKPSETATRQDIKTPARKREYRERTKESVYTTSTTGQRALPRDTSSVSAQKPQLVKEQGRRLARDRAIQKIKTGTVSSVSGKATKASGEVFKKLGTAISKAVTPSKETLLYAAGALVLILIPFVVIIGVASMLTSSGEGRSAYVPVSPEVEAYRPLIRLYAAQYGIPEYEDLIAAVMMQESGGRGSDPMQCSESGYNTRYPHAPNSITDPEYSIDVGVHTLADVLSMAAVESPIDLDRISLALQGYNFGPGYISWALANYGGYSELNAIEFSDMMASRYGWAGYGDKAYVSHVLRYYPIGRYFMGEGNAAMVAVAQTQIGNVGGAPYWSWWGLDYRVEWCAIFVSWCADQCGYLDAGVLPKMEGVRPYVDWFIERGQWQGRDYEPSPGDIIFFDWESDGLADHVGIVEKVENGLIYTVEGNTGDICAERRYTMGSAPVYGFGLPLY